MTTGVGSPLINDANFFNDKLTVKDAKDRAGVAAVVRDSQHKLDKARATGIMGEDALRALSEASRNEFTGASNAISTLRGNAAGSLSSLRDAAKDKHTAYYNANQNLKKLQGELDALNAQLTEAKDAADKASRRNKQAAQHKVSELEGKITAKQSDMQGAKESLRNAEKEFKAAREALEDGRNVRQLFNNGRKSQQAIEQIKEARTQLIEGVADKLGCTIEEAAQRLKESAKEYKKLEKEFRKAKKAWEQGLKDLRTSVPEELPDTLKAMQQNLERFAVEREYVRQETAIRKIKASLAGRTGAVDDLSRQVDDKADDVVDNKGLWKWCGENKGKAAAIGLGLAGIAALGVYACRRGKDEE